MNGKNIYDSAVKLNSAKTTNTSTNTSNATSSTTTTTNYYKLDVKDNTTFIGQIVDTATEMDDTNIIMDEILIMANAYRQAHDADTMQVMNVQSSQKESDAKSLYFYVIAATWMKKAWPILQGKADDIELSLNWREVDVGQIINETLLVGYNDTIVSGSEVDTINSTTSETAKISALVKQDEVDVISPSRYDTGASTEEVPKKSKTKDIESNLDRVFTKSHTHRPIMKPILRLSDDDNPVEINKDFFLVGSNVWLLLKQKFGFDYEIKLRCSFVKVTTALDNDSFDSLAVIMHNNQSPNNTVLVPPTGRFPYEEYLGDTRAAHTAESSNPPITIKNINLNQTSPAASGPHRQQPQPRSYNTRSTNIAVKVATANNSVINQQKQQSLGVQQPHHQVRSEKGIVVGPVVGPVPFQGITMTGNNISDDDDDDAAADDELNGINGPMDNNDSSNGTNENDETLYDMHDDNNRDPPVILLPFSTTYSNQKIGNNYDDIDHSNSNSGVGNMEDDYEYDDDDDDEKVSDIISGNGMARRRPYGSGLGNLGNTCFMNSTLQCLAHTEPLVRYFLSGEYENDLNRSNPLGTGGELATQFAKLLAEMYIIDAPRNSYNSTSRSTRYSSSYNSAISPDYMSTSHVVYPRNFKATLGKHAEQFMGYDQHDSQELATYLLDALHEDTNRVTIKPYIEKPEQEEDESDEEAAKKAWDLHLKREDSRVLENFMGLVKSRVECCQEGCGRVSTTFDPVMYLSVPIPGSSERTLQVTYVPLEPSERPKMVSVSILKTANIEELLKKVVVEVKEQFPSAMQSVPLLEDLCATDIWHREVHTWFTYKDEVEKIRDSDATFVYELRSTKEIRKQYDEKQKMSEGLEDEVAAAQLGLPTANRARYYQLDIGSLTKLNQGVVWSETLINYLSNPHQFIHAFNAKKGTTEDRVKFYRKLIMFIDMCHKDAEEATATGQKRTREENEASRQRSLNSISPSDDLVPAIEDRCLSDNTFASVRSRYDLAVLEFVASKMKKEIFALEQRSKVLYPNGIILEICMRRLGTHPGEKESNLIAPFVLRIPSDMTVFELRREIAKRLARSILPSGQRRESLTASAGQSTSEVAASVIASSGDVDSDASFGPQGLLVLRQIPLLYERKGGATYRPYKKAEQLGSITADQDDFTRPISTLASPSDDDEKVLVSEFVSNHDRIYVDWPAEKIDRLFDSKEFESVDEPDDSSSRLPLAKNKTKTVIDCIDKFCQKEQLEETEQWYCNKCRTHVRAWKQFHLYKSPPHLIVHLKRFHFSPTTHRRNKITTLIDFPLKGLDLTDHVSQWSDEGNDKPIYDCYAVTNHFGGLGGGHYTAYALNSDSTWCLYDDSRITTNVDPKDVVSTAAYVLYYRRRDVPVTEEFEYNLQTNLQYDNAIATIVRPALIQNDPESKSQTPPSSSPSSVASSNAAMVGDDDDHVMEDILPNSGNDDDDPTDQNDISSHSALGSVLDQHDDSHLMVAYDEDEYDNDSAGHLVEDEREGDDSVDIIYNNVSKKPSYSNESSFDGGSGTSHLPLQ